MHERMPNHLLNLVQQAEDALRILNAANWHESRGEGKWTRLQLLGHLIDSAANNHQRFVRAMVQPLLSWPGYDQVAHVAVQNYTSADPSVCLALWAAYNRHISHVIRQIPLDEVSTPCTIDEAPEMTLSDLVLDYVAHLEHHLRQLLPGVALDYSGMPWPPADPNRQWPT